jgi:hypothetical protein
MAAAQKQSEATAESSARPSLTLLGSCVQDCRLVVSDDNVSVNVSGPVDHGPLFDYFSKSVEGEEEQRIFVSVGCSFSVILFVGLSSLSAAGFRQISGQRLKPHEDWHVSCVGFLFSKGLSEAELNCLPHYERMQPAVAYCIVGLPYFHPSWVNGSKTSEDATFAAVLHYRTSLVNTSFHKVLVKDFLRLLTTNRSLSSTIVDWYVCFLSQSCPPGVFIMPCDLQQKLMIEFNGEGAWSKVDKYHQPFEAEGRFIYPCYKANHTTLLLLDVSTSKYRSRLASIDSLDLHDSDVLEAFEKFLEHRKFPKPTICMLGGGKQLLNETECGVFTLMNMDAAVKREPFFNIETWDFDAKKRDLNSCKVAREHYASILRHHCVQWFRENVSVALLSSTNVSASSSAPKDAVQLLSD